MTLSKIFFDYLKVLNRDLSKKRLLVFTGQSGAGKSSYIKFLLENNSTFKGAQIKTYQQRPMQWRAIQDRNSILIIDEVKSILELYYILKLLMRGNTLLVANHAPMNIFKLFGLFYRSCFFSLDDRVEKITLYLSHAGYEYSDKSVSDFSKKFGTNFIDLDIILETSASHNFDEVYYNFSRYNKIKLTKNHNSYSI